MLTVIVRASDSMFDTIPVEYICIISYICMMHNLLHVSYAYLSVY